MSSSFLASSRQYSWCRSCGPTMPLTHASMCVFTAASVIPLGDPGNRRAAEPGAHHALALVQRAGLLTARGHQCGKW
jgi:hypothetical protein